LPVYFKNLIFIISLNNDLWSVETPPSVFSPKRQKMEPEVTIKIEYFLDYVNKDHFHHVSLLQILFNSPTNDAKILNKLGEVLKENAILALCDAQIHQNHYTINKKTVGKFNNQKTKVVINHRIRGVNNIQSIKKDSKLMDYLKHNNIRISKHNWQEEEWDMSVIVFFTDVFPANMPVDYATKLVGRDLKSPVKFQTVPKFRIIPIPVKINNLKQPTTVHVYGMEVKSQDIKDMTSTLKENTNPGIFIPFQMKYINQEAYNKALSHIVFKQDNTWVIKIKYMSDTAFFRLENMIKDTLQIEYAIHIPIRNECKILVSRQRFHLKRNELKVNLAKWNQHLGSEDVRECGSLPEEAYIRIDDYSDYVSSCFSNSIRTIMYFKYDEKANPDDPSVHQSVTSAANLSPGISVPSNLSNST
jgi:hypothetical protein